MRSGKFSKTGLVLIGCMLICVILFLAVGVPNGFFGDGGKSGDLDDENTPGIGQVMDGESPLLVFDKSAGARSLMSAFDEGRVESAEVYYETDGTTPYRTDSQKEIRTIYKSIKNIVVTGEADSAKASASEGKHYVTFVFDDGSEYSYSFNGESTLVYEDADYEIKGGNDLWNFLREKCAAE